MRPTQGGASLPVTVIGYESSGGVQSSGIQTEQVSYTTPKTGEIQGSATALQLPDVPCKLVKFKALTDNAGNVYIGAAGVTIPNGSDDSTSGWFLDAGEETGWIPIDNLNRLYRICNNAGDDMVYMAVI